MAKKIMVKVFAWLALFWILIWVGGTAMLIIFWQESNTESVPITSEKLEELINSGKFNETEDSDLIWEIINVSASWSEQ